jgi:hypothetical protein
MATQKQLPIYWKPKEIKTIKLKGLAMVNLVYLIMFYIMYFPLVYTAGYILDTINALTIFAPYVATIPASTTAFMAFMLYVMVPLMALIWTIRSNAEPTYQQ